MTDQDRSGSEEIMLQLSPAELWAKLEATIGLEGEKLLNVLAASVAQGDPGAPSWRAYWAVFTAPEYIGLGARGGPDAVLEVAAEAFYREQGEEELSPSWAAKFAGEIITHGQRMAAQIGLLPTDESGGFLMEPAYGGMQAGGKLKADGWGFWVQQPEWLMVGEFEQERDGMLWLTANAADYIETIGERGAELAEELRRSAREKWSEREQDSGGPWQVWYDSARKPTNTIIVILAMAVWRDQLAEDWQSYKDNAAAIALPVYETVESMAWRPKRRVERNPDQLSLLSKENEILAHPSLPALPDERLLAIIEAGTKELRSIAAIRLFIYLVQRVHHQAFMGDIDPRVVSIEGGIQGLADAIGETSKKSPTKLRKILEAGHCWRMEWKGGAAGGLWTYLYDDSSGSHKNARLEITLGTPLAPKYTHGLKPGNRTLTPIVDIAPLIGRNRDHAPQAIFQQAVVKAIVERRKELPRHGGALLQLAELCRIADSLGLPRTTMEKALERWKHDGDDGLAFLEEVERNRYHLADNEQYGNARQFINETAKRSEKGSKRGKASARKRKKGK